MNKTIDVVQKTYNQPFCAGVLIRQGDKILVTLNPDGIPKTKGEQNFLRIGLIGGGQEPGETILECAIREAKEELSIHKVQVLSSDPTYYYEPSTQKAPIPISCKDEIAPLFFSKGRNPNPTTPYKPNLPIGPHLYFALYEAEVDVNQIQPGDDVVGLLWIPIKLVKDLNLSPNLETLIHQGCQFIERDPLDQQTRIFLAEDELLPKIVPLLDGQ